jgi:hypothetical protein
MTVVGARMVVIGVRIAVTPAVGMTGAGEHGVIVAVSNSVVADTSVGWLAGQRMADICSVLAEGTWIDGDSRSDVPLFERAGMSIALNATPDARAAATHVLDTDNLCDVLALLRPVRAG